MDQSVVFCFVVVGVGVAVARWNKERGKGREKEQTSSSFICVCVCVCVCVRLCDVYCCVLVVASFVGNWFHLRRLFGSQCVGRGRAVASPERESSLASRTCNDESLYFLDGGRRDCRRKCGGFRQKEGGERGRGMHFAKQPPFSRNNLLKTVDGHTVSGPYCTRRHSLTLEPCHISTCCFWFWFRSTTTSSLSLPTMGMLLYSSIV